MKEVMDVLEELNRQPNAFSPPQTVSQIGGDDPPPPRERQWPIFAVAGIFISLLIALIFIVYRGAKKPSFTTQ